MSQAYITQQGDTADYIAFRYYGSASTDIVLTLLQANKGLAEYGPLLPAGVTVALPEIASPEKKQGVRLWD